MSGSQNGMWTKRGVVFGPEGIPGRVNTLGGGVEALEGDSWRVWFDGMDEGRRSLGYAEGVPGEPMRRVEMAVSTGAPADAELAMGGVPEGWNPRQPQHVRLADGRHRLYFWTTAPGVIRYLAADSDDGRRYTVVDPHRACLYHPHDRAVSPNDVPDGLTPVGNLHAERPAAEPAAAAHLVVNDATTVYQLPDGSFEAYTAVLEAVPRSDPGWFAHDNARGYRRFIQRFVSADGLAWELGGAPLRPDADEPPGLQFYYLSVTHTPQGRIGLLGHYRCDDQTTDIELCFSDDGVRWRRPFRRPWLPRGKEGDADAFAAIACRSLVRKDGLWWLFYTGHNFLHNHTFSHGPEASHLLLAQIDALPSEPGR